MIWQRKCKECGNLVDLQKCPYCRELKKREGDGKIPMPGM
ncbi:hypothetical protein LCGC14_0571400 [marine sediment metagenome]|uniref:Uncharacterized protein n=1 Tax=marine sediment metagenome TaxID=412755 RepID=A0A0F9S2U8_9ZZZZ